MNRICLCCIVACTLLCLGPAAAEWIPFGSVETGLQVVESSGDRTVVEFNLAGIEMEDVDINGTVHAQYSIPGMPVLRIQGDPALPVVRQALMIPDQSEMVVRILEIETETRSTEPVAPSKGVISRDIDPADVPYVFGDVYQRAESYPAQQVALQEPFIVRDFRGAVLEIHPVIYNPSLGILEVATRVVVEVVPGDGPGVNTIDRAPGPIRVDREFGRIYQNLFLNYEPMRYQMIPEPGRCVIITYDDFHSAAEELYQWNLQKGIPTILTDLSAIGSSASNVKAHIQSLYDSPEGITYIILVGDSSQMPYFNGYNGYCSDPVYTKLAGDDLYFDAFISRISAQTLAQAETQVAKFIRWERYPDLSSPDADWYHKGVGIGSAESGGTGHTDCERTLWLKEMLMDYTYTQVDEICDPGANTGQVFTSLNDGRSILNYIGHGSGTGWGTTGFSNSHIDQLQNGHMQPIIIDVACSNGTFTMSTCFGEKWLRTGDVNTPRGAIAMYGSAGTCSWVPPTVMQYEVNRVFTQELTHTMGGMCFAGALHVVEQEGPVNGRTVAEQYNLFGDCAVYMRSDVPGAVALQHDGTLPEGQNYYEVMTPGVEEALVCLYADGVMYGAAYTDDQGRATIPVDPLPPAGTMLTLTCTGYNCETVETQVEVIIPTLANLVIESWSIEDVGDGTVNGQIEAGEQVLLTLNVQNVGSELAADVSAQLFSIGDFVTMIDSEAYFGDIGPGEIATSDEPYVFTVSPATPDEELLDFTLNITAEVGNWEQPLSMMSHKPVLNVPMVVVDDSEGGDGNGQLDPGETADLIVTLSNDGSGDGAAFEARLGSGTPLIQPTQNIAGMEFLAAGDQGDLAPPFTVSINPLMPSGEATFPMRVNGANGFTATVNFNLDIGGAASVDDRLAGVDQVWLAPVYPNPAKPGTRLAYVLPGNQRVDLAIYDAGGRLISTLIEGAEKSGVHEIRWDGRDQGGREVASGIYFAKLQADGLVLTRQFTVVR